MAEDKKPGVTIEAPAPEEQRPEPPAPEAPGVPTPPGPELTVHFVVVYVVSLCQALLGAEYLTIQPHFF